MSTNLQFRISESQLVSEKNIDNSLILLANSWRKVPPDGAHCFCKSSIGLEKIYTVQGIMILHPEKDGCKLCVIDKFSKGNVKIKRISFYQNVSE